MEEKKKEEKIGEALLKVALGYQVAEVTEEYAEVDGKMKLTKRKKTKKDIPPDLKAVQLLLATEEEGGFGELSDEELETEKARLLAMLQQGGQKVTVENGAAKGAVKSAGTSAAMSEKTSSRTSAARKATTKKIAAKKAVAKKTTAKKTVKK